MSAQHKERTFMQLTTERVTRRPFFGPKRADKLEIGTSGVLYQLGANGMPCKVDEIIELDEKGGVIVAFKPHDYGPRKWATPEDLGVMPYEDGTYSASGWFKHQRPPKNPFWYMTPLQ